MCDNIIIISLVLVFIFLALSVNTIINRRKYGLALGEGDSENLKRAVRAHGNNIEYVPGALIGIFVLVALGYSALIVHLIGAALLLARVCHAYGIQQLEVQLPKPRVLGNILTWVIYLTISFLLIFSFFSL